MRKFFIVRNQMRNVDITTISFDKNILPYLITEAKSTTAASKAPLKYNPPIYECIIETKFKDEIPKLGLDLGS